jgi:hypothetical protein
MATLMTIVEVAQKGNRALREKYPTAQLRKWANLGGRPKGSKDKKPRKRKLTKTRNQRATS